MIEKEKKREEEEEVGEGAEGEVKRKHQGLEATVSSTSLADGDESAKNVGPTVVAPAKVSRSSVVS